MKTVFAVTVLAVATGAFAADSYIPTGISAGCTTFLNTLNADSGLSTCLSSLTTATSAFSSDSSSDVSSTTLSSSLNTLCSSTACSDANTRSLLSQFYSQCGSELSPSGGNADVKGLYDVLYVFTPLKGAVCAKDATTNAFCSSSLSASKKKRSAGSLFGRADDSLPKVTPSSLTDDGLLYLFISASETQAELCTPCTKSVLQSYVTWEGKLPYGPGITQSPILSTQSDIWSTVTKTCGQSFMDAITGNAGASPLSTLSGAPSVARVPVVGSLLAIAGFSLFVMA